MAGDTATLEIRVTGEGGAQPVPTEGPRAPAETMERGVPPISRAPLPSETEAPESLRPGEAVTVASEPAQDMLLFVDELSARFRDAIVGLGALLEDRLLDLQSAVDDIPGGLEDALAERAPAEPAEPPEQPERPTRSPAFVGTVAGTIGGAAGSAFGPIVGGGVGAGVAAALGSAGPAGVALAGLAAGAIAAGDALRRITGFVGNIVGEFSEFSPQAQMALARQQVELLQQMVRAGQQQGADMAAFVEAQTDLKLAVNDFKLALLPLLTEFIIPILKAIAEALRAVLDFLFGELRRVPGGRDLIDDFLRTTPFGPFVDPALAQQPGGQREGGALQDIEGFLGNLPGPFGQFFHDVLGFRGAMGVHHFDNPLIGAPVGEE